MPPVSVKMNSSVSFEQIELVERSDSPFGPTCWNVWGSIPNRPWIAVLFDEPTVLSGHVTDVVACRVSDVVDGSARVTTSGPVGNRMPIGYVPDCASIEMDAQAFMAFPGRIELGPVLTLKQVVRSCDSVLRSLGLFEGTLYSSVDADAPEIVQRALLPLADPVPRLPLSVPELSVDEALLRIAGNVYPKAPWRVSRSSFESAWAEVDPFT